MYLVRQSVGKPVHHSVPSTSLSRNAELSLGIFLLWILLMIFRYLSWIISLNVYLRNYRFNVLNDVAFATQGLDKQEISTNLSCASACPITFFVRWNSSPCSNATNNQLFNTKEMHQYHKKILPYNPITIYLYKCYLHKLYRVPLNGGNARFTQLLKSKVINYNDILNTLNFFCECESGMRRRWRKSTAGR